MDTATLIDVCVLWEGLQSESKAVVRAALEGADDLSARTADVLATGDPHAVLMPQAFLRKLYREGPGDEVRADAACALVRYDRELKALVRRTVAEQREASHG